MIALTREIAQKVLATVDAGLVSGVGMPTPGQMCVEAAVCFALGEPHGDQPSCVGRAVCAFKIRLNDARWSSSAARAAGLRAIAIAQLGSDQIDPRAFAGRVVFAVIREVLPPMLRRRKCEKEADACVAATTLAEGYAAAKAATAALRPYATYAADAYVAYAAAAYAAAAAAAAVDAAYVAYSTANAAANADAAHFAADAAAIAANAVAHAADDRDQVLRQAADIGVRVLTELKSPGVQWLDLVTA